MNNFYIAKEYPNIEPEWINLENAHAAIRSKLPLDEKWGEVGLIFTASQLHAGRNEPRQALGLTILDPNGELVIMAKLEQVDLQEKLRKANEDLLNLKEESDRKVQLVKEVEKRRAAKAMEELQKKYEESKAADQQQAKAELEEKQATFTSKLMHIKNALSALKTTNAELATKNEQQAALLGEQQAALAEQHNKIAELQDYIHDLLS